MREWLIRLGEIKVDVWAAWRRWLAFARQTTGGRTFQNQHMRQWNGKIILKNTNEGHCWVLKFQWNFRTSQKIGSSFFPLPWPCGLSKGRSEFWWYHLHLWHTMSWLIHKSHCHSTPLWRLQCKSVLVQWYSCFFSQEEEASFKEFLNMRNIGNLRTPLFPPDV